MGQLLYNLVGIVFRVGVGYFYNLEVDGLETYSEKPSTLIVANHKRDMDSILLASVLYFREGFTRPGKPISFMGSENLFQPGFLSTWMRGPKTLRKIASPISLNRILKSLHAYPIGKLEFDSIPIHETLQLIREKEGNYPIDKVIRQGYLDKLLGHREERDKSLTISDYLNQEGYPRKKIKLSVLQKPYRKIIKRNKLGAVKKQVSRFIDLLNEGEILYITPEGRLSADGLLGPLKDSLLILIDETEPEITVTPTNITYDFLTDEKSTIFLRVGKEMEGLSELDREEKSERIRHSILELTTVTMSQLGSLELVRLVDEEDRVTVNLKELKGKVFSQLEEVRGQGVQIDDELLDKSGAQRRWDSFVAFCREEDIFHQSKRDQQVHVDPGLGYNDGVSDRLNLGRRIGYRRDPVRYCANELKALEKKGLLDL